jgi:hypothetical protein
MSNPYPQAQLNQEEYKPIESAISDLPEYTRISEINHEWTKHSQEYMKRLAQVPPGGSLSHIPHPKMLQREITEMKIKGSIKTNR